HESWRNDREQQIGRFLGAEMQRVDRGKNFRRAIAWIGMGEGANSLHGIGGVRERGIAAVVFVILAADGEAEPIFFRHDNASGPDFHIHLDRLSRRERPWLVMGMPWPVGKAAGCVGLAVRGPQPTKSYGSAGIIGADEHDLLSLRIEQAEHNEEIGIARR